MVWYREVCIGSCTNSQKRLLVYFRKHRDINLLKPKLNAIYSMTYWALGFCHCMQNKLRLMSLCGNANPAQIVLPSCTSCRTLLPTWGVIAKKLDNHSWTTCINLDNWIKELYYHLSRMYSFKWFCRISIKWLIEYWIL